MSRCPAICQHRVAQRLRVDPMRAMMPQQTNVGVTVAVVLNEADETLPLAALWHDGFEIPYN